jgi:hypothetical protein
MKIARNLLNLRVLGIFLAGLLLLAASPAAAAKYTVTLLTDQLYLSSNPICALDNRGQVLWQGPAEDGQTKIWRYYQGVNTLLGTYLYNLKAPANNGINNKYFNNHGQLVARAAAAPYKYDAFLLNGAALTALTQSTVTDYSVDSDPRITDSGYLAWGEFHTVLPYTSRIVRYLNGKYLYLDRGSSSGAWSPRVNNLGQMVWHEGVNGVLQIFFYDGATTVKITNDILNSSNPMINDRSEIIWWRRHLRQDGTSDLMRWRPGDPAPQVISPSLKSNYNLYLLNNAGQVVYSGSDGLHFWQDGADTFIEKDDWTNYPALNDKGQVAYLNNLDHVKLYDHRTGAIQKIDSKIINRYFLQINEAGQILYANAPTDTSPTIKLYLASPNSSNITPAASLLLEN